VTKGSHLRPICHHPGPNSRPGFGSGSHLIQLIYDNACAHLGAFGCITLREDGVDSLYGRLLDATKVHDVTHCLEWLAGEHKVVWTPVGGRDNNMATINLVHDQATFCGSVRCS
jgi:hypothetical protein